MTHVCIDCGQEEPLNDAGRCVQCFAEEWVKHDFANRAWNHHAVHEAWMNEPRITAKTVIEGSC